MAFSFCFGVTLAVHLISGPSGTGGRPAFTLAPLDERYTRVVLAMVGEYARNGETAELRQAGEWVCKEFPGLLELSSAMSSARAEVRQEWERQREAENRRLYPEEYR